MSVEKEFERGCNSFSKSNEDLLLSESNTHGQHLGRGNKRRDQQDRDIHLNDFSWYHHRKEAKLMSKISSKAWGEKFVAAHLPPLIKKHWVKSEEVDTNLQYVFLISVLV